MLCSVIACDLLLADAHIRVLFVPLHLPSPEVKFSAVLRSNAKLLGEGSKLCMETDGANRHDSNNPRRVCLNAHGEESAHVANGSSSVANSPVVSADVKYHQALRSTVLVGRQFECLVEGSLKGLLSVAQTSTKVHPGIMCLREVSLFAIPAVRFLCDIDVARKLVLQRSTAVLLSYRSGSSPASKS